MKYNEKLIKEAYKNVPMYIRLYNSDDEVAFEKLPIVDKNYVISNEAGAISSAYIMSYYRDEIMKCRTSGSTGKYM